MRILYVLKHNPWGVGGGCYACRGYLQLFTTLYGDAQVDACICEEYLKDARTDEFPSVRFVPVPPRSRVAKVLTPVTGQLHRHQAAARRLLDSRHYDLCIFDENGIAGSLVGEARRRGVRTVVINHNCQYEYSRDNMTSLLQRLLVLPVVVRCERRAYRECDVNIFLTEEDCELFAVRYGQSATRCIVGGCFFDRDRQLSTQPLPPLRTAKPRIVVSGTMGNVQNMDGITWLLDELLPLIPEEATVVLAGKNPPKPLVERVRGLSPRVTLVANPVDMDAIVRECDIFLCPARLGGGMKLRVMDGLRNGLPVLTHSVSARGYREFARRGVLWEFRDAAEFGQKLNEILDGLAGGTLRKEDVARAAQEQLSFGAALKKIKKETKEICIDE